MLRTSLEYFLNSPTGSDAVDTVILNEVHCLKRLIYVTSLAAYRVPTPSGHDHPFREKPNVERQSSRQDRQHIDSIVARPCH